MSTTNDKGGLLAALLEVQRQAPSLPKLGENKHFGSKYTTLDTIVETVGPLLAEHGLVWTTLPTFGPDGAPALEYRLLHATSGEAISGTMPMLLAKQDAQGFGSALTYSRRYAISAVLNLVADTDDDGNGASRSRENTGRQASGNGKTVTKEDVEAIKSALVGLTGEQIKLAFAAEGLDGTKPFGTIPQAKAAGLTSRLAGVERKS